MLLSIVITTVEEVNYDLCVCDNITIYQLVQRVTYWVLSLESDNGQGMLV